MSWFNAPPAAAPPPPPRQPAQYAPLPSSNARVAPPNRRPAAPRYEDSPPMEKRAPRGAATFNVIQAPSAEMALTNALIANERDWPGTQYVILNKNYPFSLKCVYPIIFTGILLTFYNRFSNQIPPGSLGTSRSIRQWAGLSQSGDTVQVASLDHHAMGAGIYLASLDLELAFWHEQSAPSTPPLKQEDLSRIFTNAYDGLLVSVGHLLVFDFNGVNFKAVVKGVGNINLDGDAAPGAIKMGIVTRETEINWMKDPSSSVKIQGSAKKLLSSLSDSMMTTDESIMIEHRLMRFSRPTSSLAIWESEDSIANSPQSSDELLPRVSSLPSSSRSWVFNTSRVSSSLDRRERERR